MDALTFYKLARGYKHINAFAATVQSAHETGNWTSYLWLNADNVTHYDIPLSTIKAVQLEMLAAYGAAHAKKQELRTQVEAATDKTALSAIIINF